MFILAGDVTVTSSLSRPMAACGDWLDRMYPCERRESYIKITRITSARGDWLEQIYPQGTANRGAQPVRSVRIDDTIPTHTVDLQKQGN